MADRRDEAISRFPHRFVNVSKIGVTDFEKCLGWEENWWKIIDFDSSRMQRRLGEVVFGTDV